MLEQAEILREIKTKNAYVRKLANGIVTMHHPLDVSNSTMSNFVENYQAILQIQRGEITPFLINTGNVVNIGRDAKKYMTEKLPTIASSMAMVSEAQSPLVIYTINVYLNVFTPKIPHKFFNKEKEGYNWLLQQLNMQD
ncbi:MAG: hypothetical protein ACK4K0_07555 [Flavobacteriales bacterium]